MNKGKLGWLIMLWIVIGNVRSDAQSHDAFMRYLSTEDKPIEMLQWIESEYAHSDSLPYLLATYGLRFHSDSMFRGQFPLCKPLFYQDTVASGFATCYLLKVENKDSFCNQWFRDMRMYSKAQGIREMTDIYFIQEKSSADIQVDQYPNVLRASVQRYKKSASKHPTQAALLSACVPGLGKMYIGKYRIGGNAMTMNGIFIWQTVESIRKLGIKHPLSILDLLFSSFFYASTIYGSYRDAKYFTHENLQQLYLDASDYYSVLYYPAVYP